MTNETLWLQLLRDMAEASPTLPEFRDNIRLNIHPDKVIEILYDHGLTVAEFYEESKKS